MNRLVITTEKNDFVIFDTDTKSVVFRKDETEALHCHHLAGQHRHPFRPFGIAEDKKSIYIASNDKLGQFNKATYEFEQIVDIPLWLNTHQVIKDGNTLYVCNTAIDTVGIYNLETGENKQLSLNYMSVVEQVLIPRNAEELDSRHINCIYDAGDKIYFIRHNRDIIDSDFGYFDKATLEPHILVSAGRSCHGIKIINNELISLSTGAGELISINLSSLRVTKIPLVDPNSTFLRGLEYFNGKFYIGGSINFKKTLEIEPSCYLFILDTSTGSIEKIELEDHKLINDLKFIT
jgi:hypothetical protein